MMRAIWYVAGLSIVVVPLIALLAMQNIVSQQLVLIALMAGREAS